jgi:hypothetical protein
MSINCISKLVFTGYLSFTSLAFASSLSPPPWAEFRLANLMALNSQKLEAKTIY